MSSATRYQSDAGARTINGTASQFLERNKRLGMSPRQQTLNRLWAAYRCENYAARRIDWDGRENVDPVETEAIATAGFIPPGYYDAGGQMNPLPLKFRKPTAPYNLVKVICDRFTGLLFSERRHPQIRVEGDPATEDFVHALAETARLWPTMIQARTFGGATGTVAVGFQFLRGKPIIEVHDPRWMRPEFIDRVTMELRAIEKRFMFPVEEQNPENGDWEEVWYWYRRIIDMNADTLWKPQLVGDGEEPDWDNPASIEEVVEHNFGECPVQWVQNMPVADDIDGDPDCLGVYDMIETIDALIAQANRGTLFNCDPTLFISSTDPLTDITKGSGVAIKVTNGDGKFIEMTGSGPKAARELADELRHKALEVAQCVLEHPDMANRTATEIERVYSSMLAKADVLREQYGERCVKPLLEKMVRAAKMVTTPVAAGGEVQRGTLTLPDKFEKGPDGAVQRTARQLGPGGVLKLQWPGYFEPVLTDVQLAVRAAADAQATGLIDKEHAAKYVADYFRVEDVNATLAKAQQEQAQMQNQLAQQALDNLNRGGAGVPAAPPAVPGGALGAKPFGAMSGGKK